MMTSRSKFVFFDTADIGLRKSNYVFRERRSEATQSSELTLKTRNADRFLVSGCDTAEKFKFEEAIKTQKHSLFVSLYSKSSKVKDSSFQDFSSLGDLKQHFPSIENGVEGYADSVGVGVMGGVVAKQSVLDDFKFEIVEGLKVECGVIEWRTNKQDIPSLYEFSFRYKDKGVTQVDPTTGDSSEVKGLEPFSRSAAESSIAILGLFFDGPLNDWSALDALTKTSYAYSYA